MQNPFKTGDPASGVRAGRQPCTSTGSVATGCGHRSAQVPVGPVATGLWHRLRFFLKIFEQKTRSKKLRKTENFRSFFVKCDVFQRGVMRDDRCRRANPLLNCVSLINVSFSRSRQLFCWRRLLQRESEKLSVSSEKCET